MDGSAFDGLVAQPDTLIFSEEAKEETPSESPTEKTEEVKDEAAGQAEDTVEDVPKDLDDKPLHKDSRFKRVIEERNRLRGEVEELLSKSSTKEDASKHQETTSRPAWFSRYFGDDEEAWNGFKQMTSAAKEEAKAEAIKEIKAQEEATRESARKATEWVEEQIDTLSESGEKFEKNALLKVMDKYRPTDENGNLDFNAGLEILKLQVPEKKMDARKKIADSLNSSGGKTEPAKRDYKTASELRKLGGWDSI